MNIANVCSNRIISIAKEASLVAAAKLMQQNNIGALVVVDNKDHYPIPCGIITDRDITLQLLSLDNNLDTLTVADRMSQDLLLVNHHQEVSVVMQQLCTKGVRRAPVVDDQGKLVGMVSTDDLLILLADQLSTLAALVRRQLKD